MFEIYDRPQMRGVFGMDVEVASPNEGTCLK